MGKKQKQDNGKPQAPKRALSAFFLYRQDVYDKVKSQHPEAKMTDITQIISKQWGQIDADSKKKYEELYSQNKVKADIQRQEYQAKYGKIERKKKKQKNQTQPKKNQKQGKKGK